MNKYIVTKKTERFTRNIPKAISCFQIKSYLLFRYKFKGEENYKKKYLIKNPSFLIKKSVCGQSKSNSKPLNNHSETKNEFKNLLIKPIANRDNYNE